MHESRPITVGSGGRRAGLAAAGRGQAAPVGARRARALSGPHPGRARRSRARGLPPQRRHPRHPGDRRRPAAHQRAAGQALRGQPPRGPSHSRRRAHGGGPPARHGPRRAARRRDHQVPLPASSVVSRDGGPDGRDGLGPGSRLLARLQGPRDPRRDGEEPRLHPRDGRARPEPPVGPRLEHRERAVRAHDRGPDRVHQARGEAPRTASTPPACARSTSSDGRRTRRPTSTTGSTPSGSTTTSAGIRGRTSRARTRTASARSSTRCASTTPSWRCS